MAKYNIEDENIEINLERLFKQPSEDVYRAWTEEAFLKQWFMTTERTNQSIKLDIDDNGSYEIVDQINGKRNLVKGQFLTLSPFEYIEMTVGMPEISDDEDKIEVEIFEREPGVTQMNVTYIALLPKERRLSTLEYKQKKKEYHDSTKHGFEIMFDRMQQALFDEEQEDDFS